MIGKTSLGAWYWYVVVNLNFKPSISYYYTFMWGWRPKVGALLARLGMASRFLQMTPSPCVCN